MRISISNETLNVADGVYEATIASIICYDPDENGDNKKALVKLDLSTGEVLVKNYATSELGEHPWSTLFKALNTEETDDLVGLDVEIEIKNNKSKTTGTVFSNIRKIKLIEK